MIQAAWKYSSETFILKNTILSHCNKIEACVCFHCCCFEKFWNTS